MVAIYLTDVSREELKKIKKNNPDFNLSNFVQLSLMQYTGNNLADLEELYNKIADNKIKIDMLNSQIINWENKINMIKEQRDKEEFNIKLREQEKIKQEELLNQWKNLTQEQLNDYKNGVKSGKWRSTLEYLEYLQNNEVKNE